MCAAIDTASWYFACAVHAGLKRCEWFQSATRPFPHVHDAQTFRNQNAPPRFLTARSYNARPMTSPLQPVSVAQYGIGPIGAEIARLLLAKKWVRVVAAVDIDPAKIG